MKRIICLLFFVLISCKQAEFAAEESCQLFFELPQPINDSELSKIPNKYLGRFISSDSTFLNLEKNYIWEERYYKNKISKIVFDSLKTDFVFEEVKLVSKDIPTLNYNYRILKDSIELTEKRLDTIFTFSNIKKAKRIDGQLILNEKDSVFWKVRMIRIDKNVLKIKYLSFGKDLFRIDSITKIKSKLIDSTRCILKPSRSEFKKIMNLKDIGQSLIYKKVE